MYILLSKLISTGVAKRPKYTPIQALGPLILHHAKLHVIFFLSNSLKPNNSIQFSLFTHHEMEHEVNQY